MIKKIISLFVLCSMLLSICVRASFSDVTTEDIPLKAAIDFLLEKGITKGINETEFGVDENVTRQQMAAFIYRAKNGGQSPEGGKNITTFTDLNDSTFYTMISWANTMGIIKGVSQTEFNPNGSITLQDALTMLVRALDGEKDGMLSYPDGYIEKAKEMKITNNLDQNIANTDELKRGDIAILLHNAFASYNNENVLDGKKIILIGNSFTYYGKTVIDKGQNIDDEVMLQRFDDKGYFYQMCKQNGANVSVTNWTWGGHTLSDTFGGSCKADRGHDGHDHLADLKRLCDMNYDYVVIQPGSADSDETVRSGIELIQKIFKEANPNVKFIYNIHPRYYLRANENDKILVAGIDQTAKDYNLIVVNWGKMVSDLISGNIKIENSKLEYNKNSFIVTKSKSDGYHPNMLSGYILTQTLYSALTGEKAEGEIYFFCTDKTVYSKFSVPNHLKSYYTYDNISPEDAEIKLSGDELTTFPEIFESPEDMLGIQKLIDSYLALNE